MTIDDFLEKDLGVAVSVFNEPFTQIGRATITLKGGTKMIWLYDEDDRMISLVVEEDELVLFEKIHEELETDGESVLYQNKEYEFTYEDAGKVSEVTGDSETEDDDAYLFSDYESANGQLIRMIENENTGESGAYFGRVVSVDDLAEL
jgi:hypothetical protein